MPFRRHPRRAGAPPAGAELKAKGSAAAPSSLSGVALARPLSLSASGAFVNIGLA